MAGKIPKLYKMKDVYLHAKEMGLLKTHDGYMISEYEFSKAVHDSLMSAMSFSIKNREQVQLFADFSVYPVQTKCTRFIPKRIVTDDEGNVKKKNLNVADYGYSFAFLFMNSPKKYRGFKFTTAPKVKAIIMEERKKGVEFLDITRAAGDRKNSSYLSKSK